MKLKLREISLQTISTPFLIMIGISAVILSPFTLNKVCAAEITLAWDANTESNLVGYKLYYESEADVDSYQGTDANEGDSPIIIYCDELTEPNDPSYTVSGLDIGHVYYFKLTAFDIDGLESDFSEVVGAMAEEDDTNFYKSAAGDSAMDDAGDDSGGGTACFLSAAMNSSTSCFPVILFENFLFFSVVVLMALIVFQPSRSNRQ